MSNLQDHAARARRAEVLHRFDTFEIGGKEIKAIAEVRTLFQEIAMYVLLATKDSREQSLALTSLEEAKYWTNQSIAKDGSPK